MNIIQIKGKQNLAPKEKYLPFVQDFVRSQKWGQVRDLHNTGLVDTSRHAAGYIPDWTPEKALRYEQLQKSGELQPYMTIDELQQLLSPKPEQGFAAGGLVNAEPVSYNPDLVDSMVEQLRTELMHGQ